MKRTTRTASPSRVRLVDGTLADPADCKEGPDGKPVSKDGVPVALDAEGHPVEVEMEAGTYRGPDVIAGEKLSGDEKADLDKPADPT